MARLPGAVGRSGLSGVWVRHGRVLVDLANNTAPSATQGGGGVYNRYLDADLDGDERSECERLATGKASRDARVRPARCPQRVSGKRASVGNDTFDKSAFDKNYVAAGDSVEVSGRAWSPSGLWYGYTGRPLDPETGLMHYRARAYHPTLKAFLQRDPIAYSDSSSLYQYVTGRVLGWIDPFGLFSEDGPCPSTGAGGKYLGGDNDEEADREIKRHEAKLKQDLNEINHAAKQAQVVGDLVIDVGGELILVGIPGPEDIVFVGVVKIGGKLYKIWKAKSGIKKVAQLVSGGAESVAAGAGKVPKKPSSLVKIVPDPTVCPGEGWKWRSRPGVEPGKGPGNWVNEETGEWLHRDTTHHKKPHWDYQDPSGERWRVFDDGTVEPKCK